MSLTIQKEPTSPAFSKAIVAYQVETDTKLAVHARVWVEDTPYSTTWTHIAELKSIPNESGECTFYLEGLLENDILDYDLPDLVNPSGVCNKVSRRIKIEFYEYDPSDLSLIEEYYHTSSDKQTNSELQISEPLTTGEDYILILETDLVNPPTPSVELDSAGVNQAFTKLYDLGDEVWYEIIGISQDHDEINLPGYTKAKLFAGTKPVVTEPANPRTVLLSGNFFTDLENTTFERTPDGIIITTPDGIGVRYLF